MIQSAPILELLGVGKRFAGPRGPVEVLREVNLRVSSGEFIALTGPSGSGKSTLLNLAALLDTPSQGALLLDGEDTSGLDQERLSELRKTRVGMVFQKFCLLPYRTARENVLFRFRYLHHERAQAEQQTDAVMDTLGIRHLAHQPARLLSGGEMQRVAIARAVALRPRMLVADEPTGNLDSESAHAVMEAFRTLNNEGITILMATHNTTLLKYFSRRLEVRDGNVSEQ